MPANEKHCIVGKVFATYRNYHTGPKGINRQTDVRLLLLQGINHLADLDKHDELSTDERVQGYLNCGLAGLELSEMLLVRAAKHQRSAYRFLQLSSCVILNAIRSMNTQQPCLLRTESG